jgi:hypothetical protein
MAGGGLTTLPLDVLVGARGLEPMETTATEQKHVRAAACSCGQLTLTTTGEPVSIFVGIPVGAFADPGFPTPQVSIYEEHRHPWVGLSADIAPEPR